MVDSWVAGFDSWDVCDQVCMNLREIAKINCKAAQWIAKDAIRELESPAVQACLTIL